MVISSCLSVELSTSVADVEAGSVSVRKRGEGDLGAVSIDEFVDTIIAQVNSKEIW